jgi:hypothetical protein
MDVGFDQAVAGLAAGLLRGGREPLLAEDVHRLLDIATGLLERLLAVERASAGALAEILDLFRSDGQVKQPPFLMYTVDARFAGDSLLSV